MGVGELGPVRVPCFGLAVGVGVQVSFERDTGESVLGAAEDAAGAGGEVTDDGFPFLCPPLQPVLRGSDVATVQAQPAGTGPNSAGGVDGGHAVFTPSRQELGADFGGGLVDPGLRRGSGAGPG